MKDKIILDLCGGTGAWSNPYREAGYQVLNITLPEYDITKWRSYPELVKLIEKGKVYGILAAPPCTSFSFARSTGKTMRDLKGGHEIMKACLEIIWECQFALKSNNAKETPLKFWALENPFGLMRRFLGHPVQIIQRGCGEICIKKRLVYGDFLINQHLRLPNINQLNLTNYT